MVIGILKTGLESIMIDVTDREIGLDPWYSQSLELKISQCSGGVLGQSLINSDRDLVPRNHLSGDEMALNYLFSYS